MRMPYYGELKSANSEVMKLWRTRDTELPLLEPEEIELELATSDEDLELEECINQLWNNISTCLPRRYVQILYMRFMKDMTFEEIGITQGLCQERIRQIENKALRMLRHPSRVEKLGSVPRSFTINEDYFKKYNKSRINKEYFESVMRRLKKHKKDIPDEFSNVIGINASEEKTQLLLSKLKETIEKMPFLQAEPLIEAIVLKPLNDKADSILFITTTRLFNNEFVNRTIKQLLDKLGLKYESMNRYEFKNTYNSVNYL